ncbi:MAG: ankyrin repeat domain-containing protein [Xanthobacteraceae bacterium]
MGAINRRLQSPAVNSNLRRLDAAAKVGSTGFRRRRFGLPGRKERPWSGRGVDCNRQGRTPAIGTAMTRRLLRLALLGLGLGSAGAAAVADGMAHAQVPPTERELRIYAGLHDAAARGDVAEIEQLIAEGEKPKIQDANSRTPLHVAAFLGRHEAARALIRLGADPNALDAQRYDIVTIAAVNNDLEMLAIAIDGGGNARAITGPYDGTALIAAAHRGHAAIVRALIAAGAQLNHANNHGWTALLEAVVLGNGGTNHTATVETLVTAGADVMLPDRYGTTALAHARTRGYSQIARILENAGAR